MTDRLAEIEALDAGGIGERRKFIADHLSAACWRSCRTLVNVDVPAMMDRIHELEGANAGLQAQRDGAQRALAKAMAQMREDKEKWEAQAAADAKIIEAAQQYFESLDDYTAHSMSHRLAVYEKDLDNAETDVRAALATRRGKKQE